MDLDLSEEQEMLKTTARDFLTNECPMSLVRQMMQDEKGYPPELWHKIANLGWLGLVIPEQYAGSGGSFLDLTILLQETGRVLLPGPFFSTVVFGALPIVKWGNDGQKQRFLPEIARGNLVFTLAFVEESSGHKPLAKKSSAVRDGDDFVLSGTRLFVPDSHIADWILWPAKSSENGKEGLTVFLVDTKNQGVSSRLLKTMSGAKQCEVILDKVRLGPDCTLGEAGDGELIISRTLELATVAKCAEMLGSAERVLEMTTAYARERHQFGSPIGSFQAIQHQCANMAIDVDGMRLATYQAAWMLSQDLPCAKQVAVAKVWSSDAYKRVALLGVRIHGGIGFMEDHDASLFFKNADMAEFAFGDADFHREQLAGVLTS